MRSRCPPPGPSAPESSTVWFTSSPACPVPSSCSCPASAEPWIVTSTSGGTVTFIVPAPTCTRLLTSPEDEATLLNFYTKTRPWGAWGPIRDKAVATIPGFQPNHDFRLNMFNVAIGIVWQLCLTALPIYVVLQRWNWAIPMAATLVAMSIVLKFTWYDRLENDPA